MTAPLVREINAKTGHVVDAPLSGAELEEWQMATFPPLPEAKARAKAALAARRWAAEQSGTTVGGLPVATDTASQVKVVGAAVAAQMDPGYSVQWKTAAGFITLDAATVIGLAQAIRTHIQACFDHEAALTAAIDAAEDHDALKAIDLDAGWP